MVETEWDLGCRGPDADVRRLRQEEAEEAPPPTPPLPPPPRPPQSRWRRRKKAAGGQVSSADVCRATSAKARPGGGWDFTSSCDMGDAGHMDTVSAVTGDMWTRFQTTSTVTTTGAKVAESNGTLQTTLSAERLGDCPADFAPGDMELPGGQRMNIAQAG